MSNSKLNPHIHFIETKNALHTWVIISGWSFDGRVGIDLKGDSNILIISYYDPYELSSWCNAHLADYVKTPFSVLAFSLGALWLSHNPTFFMSALKRVFVGIRKHYGILVITPIKHALQENYLNCVKLFQRQCLSAFMRNQNMQLYDSTLLNPFVLDRGLTYLEEKVFNEDVIQPKDVIVHGMLDKIAPLKELDFIDQNQIILQKKMGHLCLLDLNTLVG